MEIKLCSGYGQYHSIDNKIDPQDYIPITLNDVKQMLSNPPSTEKKYARWSIFSKLFSRTHKKQLENGSFYALWLDIDEVENLTFDIIYEKLDSFLPTFWIYSSSGSTKQTQKCRVIIPLKEMVSGHRFIRLQKILNDKIESLGIPPDRATQRAGQICYLPNKGEYYKYKIKNDDLISPDFFKNEEEKEIIRKKQEEIERNIKKQKAKEKALKYINSNEKNPVDAYNESHSLCFLLKSYGYIKKGNRWLSPNSQSKNPGVSIIENETKWISAHSSDIGIGTEVNGCTIGNAFDLLVFFEYGGDRKKAFREVAKMYEVSHEKYNFDEIFGIIPSKEVPLLNDTFNAKIFIENHKEITTFCDSLGGWLIYNGKTWNKDTENKILKLANKTYENIKSMNPPINDLKVWKNHVKSTGNSRNITSFVSLSKMELSTPEHNFDKNHDIICLENGIYDLKEHHLLPHSPKHLITKQADVVFEKHAECPTWEKFLKIIFQADEDLIKYIQKLCGYCLTADVSRQIFPILWGSGANGKSTFCLTLSKMLKEYSKSTNANTFMASTNDKIPNDVAALRGSRFVIASETEKSKVLDTTTIKNFTSSEPISVRFLNKEYFELIPTFKVFLLSNALPEIKMTDDGTWRRIRLIPFNHKFEEQDKIIDYHVSHLYPEISGIFNWCVEGLKILNDEGEKVPDCVDAGTKDYKDSENMVGNFLDEYCDVENGFEIKSSDMWKHYIKCMAQEGSRPLKKHDFFSLMTMNGYKRTKSKYGVNKNQFCFFNIKLKTIQTTTDIKWEE